MPSAGLEEAGEAIAQGDVVQLQERGVVDPTVGEVGGDIVGLPVVGNGLCGLVAHEVAGSPEGVRADILEALADVVKHIVANVGTQSEAEVPVLVLQA